MRHAKHWVLTALCAWACLPAAAQPFPAPEVDPEPPVSEADPSTVAALCRRARLGDADSQYELGWLYSHGQGDLRRDDWAHWLFYLAGQNGRDDARKLVLTMTWPQATKPDCFDLPGGGGPPTVELKPPAQIERLVNQLAPQFKINPRLALSIISVESNFNTVALSNKNAMGLMQLIPATARRFGVVNAFDPRQNISGGLAYLRWLLAYYQGDVRLVAAAYNAGEGNVDRYRGVPPFAETQDYVRRVVARFGHGPHPFDANVTAPSRIAQAR